MATTLLVWNLEMLKHLMFRKLLAFDFCYTECTCPWQ